MIIAKELKTMTEKARGKIREDVWNTIRTYIEKEFSSELEKLANRGISKARFYPGDAIDVTEYQTYLDELHKTIMDYFEANDFEVRYYPPYSAGNTNSNKGMYEIMW